MSYHECLQKMASKFRKIRYQYMPRMQNQLADALATLASMVDRPKGAYYMAIEGDEG